MKKFIMAIVCLMTMVMSANAQDDMYYSKIKKESVKPKSIKETLQKIENADIYLSLCTPIEGERIVANGSYELSLIKKFKWWLYPNGEFCFEFNGNGKFNTKLDEENNLTKVIEFLNIISIKANEWKKICDEKNASDLRKIMPLPIKGLIFKFKYETIFNSKNAKIYITRDDNYYYYYSNFSLYAEIDVENLEPIVDYLKRLNLNSVVGEINRKIQNQKIIYDSLK